MTNTNNYYAYFKDGAKESNSRYAENHYMEEQYNELFI